VCSRVISREQSPQSGASRFVRAFDLFLLFLILNSRDAAADLQSLSAPIVRQYFARFVLVTVGTVLRLGAMFVWVELLALHRVRGEEPRWKKRRKWISLTAHRYDGAPMRGRGRN